MLTYADVVAARERIRGGVFETPCFESAALSELCGAHVFTKLEYLQRTGSFKERGARNALLLLSAEQRRRGVIAASAGNHALALSYHGRALGAPVTVVMPEIAPLIKQRRCGQMGARVVLHGQNIAEARVRADEIAAAEGFAYVHGYDDPGVIAGAGTLGMEILEEVDKPDAIVVPIGGGGLVAGLAISVHTAHPEVEIIGVEPERAASWSHAVARGGAERADVRMTVADGLAVPQVGERAFAIGHPHVRRVVRVSEDEITLAIYRIAELGKGIVEGAGAAPLAALLSGQLDDLAGKRVVLPLCGGNIDPAIIGRVMDFGMVADSRLIRFLAFIPDRPGGLNRLTGAIAEVGASVQEVVHDRTFGGADFSVVQVQCTVETRDADHMQALYDALFGAGIETRPLPTATPRVVPEAMGR